MKGGPTQAEVLQGTDNDCTVFAAMGSLVAVSPNSIVNLIKLVGKTSDGVDVYGVTLFGQEQYSLQSHALSSEPQTILVDARFPAVANGNNYTFPYDELYGDPTNGSLVLWPHILQKAFAFYYGSYEAILSSAPAEIAVLTGQTPSVIFNSGFYSIDPNASLAKLSQYVGAGYVTTVDSVLESAGKANDGSATAISPQGAYSCVTITGTTYCLATNHEYEVLAFDGSIITLRNPWGINLNSPDSANGVVSLPLAAYSALTLNTYSASVSAAP